MIRYSLFALCIILMTACGGQKIKVPDHSPANLQAPTLVNPPDFLIESVDLINHSRSAGKARDTILGAESDLELTADLLTYFEAETVSGLQSRGYRCAWYTGPEYFQSLTDQNIKPPLHLRLELQDLALSRTSSKGIIDEHVVGTCKLRGVLFDPDRQVIFQRQFVGNVDTKRPTKQLVPSGVRFISHRGLSSLLSNLLQNTVTDFRDRGLDDAIQARELFNARFDYQSADQMTPTPAVPGFSGSRTPPVPPITIGNEDIEQPSIVTPSPPPAVTEPATPAPEPSEPVNDDDVEWVW